MIILLAELFWTNLITTVLFLFFKLLYLILTSRSEEFTVKSVVEFYKVSHTFTSSSGYGLVPLFGGPYEMTLI